MDIPAFISGHKFLAAYALYSATMIALSSALQNLRYRILAGWLAGTAIGAMIYLAFGSIEFGVLLGIFLGLTASARMALTSRLY